MRQSVQLTRFLIDLAACVSVSKVWEQSLVKVLTSFSVYHTFDTWMKFGGSALVKFCTASLFLSFFCFFFCCQFLFSVVFFVPYFFLTLFLLPPPLFLYSVCRLWVWVLCQSYPLGEEDSHSSGLWIGSHQSGRLVAQQASHTKHTQWYVQTHLCIISPKKQIFPFSF